MKNFDELTANQKQSAIDYALKELKDVINMGIITSNIPITNEAMEQLAIIAAEGALYDDDGEKIEYTHVGGCV